MKADAVVIESPKRLRGFLGIPAGMRYPVMAAIFHCVYFFGMFYLFPRVPLWIMLVLGFIYSVSISWNINGISHNFIHNPYFRSPLLNRLFSIFESIIVGFSQVFYECIHMQHHKGNADRPGKNGETVDWISIYKHGHDRHPRRSQLALHLFPGAVLVPWPLPFLSQWLLPPLWRQPGRTACVGSKQL